MTEATPPESAGLAREAERQRRAAERQLVEAMRLEWEAMKAKFAAERAFERHDPLSQSNFIRRSLRALIVKLLWPALRPEVEALIVDVLKRPRSSISVR